MLTDILETAQQTNRLAFKTWEMWVSAGTVIQLRMMQMATGTLRPEEAVRMVFEKPTAFASGTERAMRAMAGGQGFAAASLAALDPISRSAGSNAKRLGAARGRR
jgi:hypothetical protein